jgi:hypothetical protein
MRETSGEQLFRNLHSALAHLPAFSSVGTHSVALRRSALYRALQRETA